LNNSLFIKIIVNLNLSNLCFNDCNSLFNLIIRYLCNHNLHFIFNFIYKLTFVLSIHRSTLTTSQHASYVCSVFGTAALEHRKHLFKLKFNIYVYGVIYWCFRTCHAGRTVFSLVGNSAIISRKQCIFICLRQRSQSLPLASRNIKMLMKYISYCICPIDISRFRPAKSSYLIFKRIFSITVKNSSTSSFPGFFSFEAF
jgi:hypothetical protein